jgi:hypothetical protein
LSVAEMLASRNSAYLILLLAVFEEKKPVGDEQRVVVDAAAGLSSSTRAPSTRLLSKSRPALLRAAGLAAGAVLCAAVVPLATSPALAQVASPSTVSFFGEGGAPTTANWNDPTSNELGLRFKSDVKGVVTAIRFYKGSQNTGTHTGSLWAKDGHSLATVIFSNETESGWQTATFTSPVAINANTTYVASYFTSVGFYSVNVDAFATSGLDRGPLHVTPMGGAYRLSAGFPENQSKHNYWVDIVFKPEQATSPTPSPGSPSPSASAHAPSDTPSSAPAAVPSPAPSQHVAGAGGSLPITGMNVGLIAGSGLLLAGVGAALLLVYRRRDSVNAVD